MLKKFIESAHDFLFSTVTIILLDLDFELYFLFFIKMTVFPYLDPTSPAYYWDFHRPRTLLCFSIRQFLHLVTIIDIIFSSIGFFCGLTYLIIDQLSQIKLFQSNKFLENLRHLPIGIFYDNRILFRPFWTINVISKTIPAILYLHILLNGLSLFCSINMLSAIKYYKLYRGRWKLFLFSKIQLLLLKRWSTLLIKLLISFIRHRYLSDGLLIKKTRWKSSNFNRQHCLNKSIFFSSIELIYGKGDFGFFTANMNIFCLGILEFLWKILTIAMIFRSIQFIRDYHLQKKVNFTTDNQSSTVLVIHIVPNK